MSVTLLDIKYFEDLKLREHIFKSEIQMYKI